MTIRGLFLSSRCQPIPITREQTRFLHVREPEQLLREPLEPQSHPTMRRHAVTERFEISFDVAWGQPASAEALDELVVPVNPLPTGADLDAVEEQVERARARWIGFPRHVITWPAIDGVTGHEQQRRFQFVRRPLTDHFLGLGVEIAVDA